MHVTLSFWGDKILKEGVIKAIPCKEFSDEPLTYFFYGTARYRSRPAKASLIHLWLPMAFILKLDTTKLDIKRVFPFDSGAFKGGQYGETFHPAMPIEDFQLSAGSLAAQKCVQTFYGDNQSYLTELPISGLKYPAANFHINSYIELISNGTPDELDHRRSAIEFQIGTAVDLNQHEVIAVVIPDRLMDDEDFVNRIRSLCKVDPISYKTSKAPSDFLYGGLSQVVGQVISKLL